MILAAVSIILVPAVAVLLIRSKFVLVTVCGESMSPTLADGERLLVKRVGLAGVTRGDIVVVRHSPGNEPNGRAVNLILIKRAVAVPGDAMSAEVAAAGGVPSGSPVPAGHVVLLGDNEANSLDSRTCGPFGADSLIGVTLRRRRHRGRSPATGSVLEGDSGHSEKL